MFWLDWRELEKHNDWGVRDKDDATALLWNDSADMWEKRSQAELEFAVRQIESLRITKDDTVMDVCCGTGPLTIGLARKAGAVTAFDFNDRMLEYVRKKAEAAGLDNISYLQGNFNTINPGEDFVPCDIAVTRHSPAQGNILKFSRFARKYCYSLSLVYKRNDAFPLPGKKGGGWLRSAQEKDVIKERPDGRKYGLNITFNLLYESGADPEISYIDDVKILRAENVDALAKLYFPNAQTDEITQYVRNHAYMEDSLFCIEKRQTMAVMGWDPSDIDWDMLEKNGY